MYSDQFIYIISMLPFLIQYLYNNELKINNKGKELS